MAVYDPITATIVPFKRPGPVTEAIAAMRGPAAAAGAAPFGTEACRLADLSVSGLISLYEGYYAAGMVLSDETKAPRAGEPATNRLLMEASSRLWDQAEIVLAELAARDPQDGHDAFLRLRTLVLRHAGHDDFAAVRRLLDDAERVA